VSLIAAGNVGKGLEIALLKEREIDVAGQLFPFSHIAQPAGLCVSQDPEGELAHGRGRVRRSGALTGAVGFDNDAGFFGGYGRSIFLFDDGWGFFLDDGIRFAGHGRRLFDSIRRLNQILL
jgi:hypothetical protein